MDTSAPSLNLYSSSKKSNRFFFFVGGCLPTLVILLSYLVLGQYIVAQNRKLKAIGQVCVVVVVVVVLDMKIKKI